MDCLVIVEGRESEYFGLCLRCSPKGMRQHRCSEGWCRDVKSGVENSGKVACFV